MTASRKQHRTRAWMTVQMGVSLIVPLYFLQYKDVQAEDHIHFLRLLRSLGLTSTTQGPRIRQTYHQSPVQAHLESYL